MLYPTIGVCFSSIIIVLIDTKKEKQSISLLHTLQKCNKKYPNCRHDKRNQANCMLLTNIDLYKVKQLHTKLNNRCQPSQNSIYRFWTKRRSLKNLKISLPAASKHTENDEIAEESFSAPTADKTSSEEIIS